jgi:hypothetical protein
MPIKVEARFDSALDLSVCQQDSRSHFLQRNPLYPNNRNQEHDHRGESERDHGNAHVKQRGRDENGLSPLEAYTTSDDCLTDE